MLSNSLQIRGLLFAFLFGPPRFIEREEASKVHGAVCDALGHDDLSFHYSTSGEAEKAGAKGFSIALQRKEGRGNFSVTIDNKHFTQPIRLLLEYNWPPSREHAKEKFDMTQEAAFEALAGDWQRVLAEVRIRAQCDTLEHDGLGFIRKKLLSSTGDWVARLGSPLSFCGLKFEVATTPPKEVDPLEGPKRELNIELLREDPRSLYLDQMSQWPQISSVPSIPGQLIPANTIRKITAKPSEYVDNAYDYLVACVNSLAAFKEKL